MKVYFRADGDSRMGLGHIVRCGALADMVKQNWQCILFTRCSINSVLEEARRKFQNVIQLSDEGNEEDELRELAAKITVEDMLVLDGYHFKENYQKQLIKRVASLVCIDDIHAYNFRASVIINTAGGVRPSQYTALAETQFYLGPSYTLLRQPFLQKAARRAHQQQNNNLFICLGGSDPNNDTLEVVQALIRINRFKKYYIVVGGGYQYYEQLKKFISDKEIDAFLFKGVDAVELANIMSQCSYAVCSPSTVSYEYMTVGGVLFLKQIAANQQDMINYLLLEGLAFPLEAASYITAEEANKSLQKQATVFDGKAGERLRMLFEKLALAQRMHVRKVHQKDMALCYEWVNDPFVREQSYNSEPIMFAAHEAWFIEMLNDKDTYYYILELEDTPFAQIRFKVDGSNAVLSYLIDTNYRSKGLGVIVLSKGIQAFASESERPMDIVGYVKFSNIASQRSFEKLNFIKEEAIEYKASYKYVMHYNGNTNR